MNLGKNTLVIRFGVAFRFGVCAPLFCNRGTVDNLRQRALRLLCGIRRYLHGQRRTGKRRRRVAERFGREVRADALGRLQCPGRRRRKQAAEQARQRGAYRARLRRKRFRLVQSDLQRRRREGRERTPLPRIRKYQYRQLGFVHPRLPR